MNIFSYFLKGGNWYLIPTNITLMYRTVRDKYTNQYDSTTELLFITGVSNAINYIEKDPYLPERIYKIAENFSRMGARDEENMVCWFSKQLMFEYFLQDSHMNPQEIFDNIASKHWDILKNVSREFGNHGYSNSINENTIAYAKNLYKKMIKSN